MHIVLVAPGKVRQAWLKEGCDHYAKRLRNYCSFRRIDAREPVHRASHPPDILKRRLAAEIVKHLPDAFPRILLDVGGDPMSTEDLAAFLARYQRSGARGLSFIIGGPIGVDSKGLAPLTKRISLSPMTLPHDLTRLIFLEQLYRAHSILKGEPYHHG